ncbi:BAG family molecular chaperone regulator 6 [Senna tora]|uniref:BAG family molecular chaperone regulator 6 n=1 Tax=Senna tora TaxID=362788 RepID=A0A834WK14_9FABA|nr:BAG family molecular chaperone regulator 6 [Senna tora]
MAFPHYYQPGMEAIPPQMNVDPSKSPFAYEQPWPYAGSYGYPTPMQFCCGHHKLPNYCSYKPAYPHIPPSSPMYFPGGCPAYVDHFYVPYAPPPHYTTELPRYEYDKCMPREFHCCGCPNHTGNHKEGKTLKIEEQEPDVEKKVNNAVAPIHLKNYPYPFVWIPSEYTGNRELKKPVVSEMGDQDISHGRKLPEDVKADLQKPKVWNGWFQLDINSLANMTQDGNERRNKNEQISNTKKESEDGRKSQNQQGENNRREFPFPIIWMPNYNMQDGRTSNKESASTPKAIQEAPHACDTPINSCAENDVSKRTNVNGNNLKTDGSDVRKEAKNEGGGTPMKQMELHQGKNDSESKDTRVRNIPVRQIERDLTNKESQTNEKKQSTSPRKTSKLPPVCLRVDPLPKKKNGSASSRFPSPPTSKEHSQATGEGTSKGVASSSMHDKARADVNVQNSSNVNDDEVKRKEKSIKVVERSSEKKDVDESGGPQNHDKAQEGCIEVLKKYSEKKDENKGDGSQSQITSNITSVEENKIEEKEAEVNANSVKEEEEIVARGARDSTKLTDGEPPKERKGLSDVEAAVLIQAAYRGFQVRKWELPKKLKQIAEVSKHVADVKHSIQTLESSFDFQNDERQRVTIGETIMRLLLKLDTIQGLHPSFREMRKSLAKELTSLQEKLDSIMLKRSQHMEELLARKHVDDIAVVASDGEYMQEQPENKALEQGNEDSFEGSIRETHDILDLCRDQLSMKEDNPSLPGDDAKCESSSPIDPVVSEETKPSPNGMVNEDVSHASTDAFSRSGIPESAMATQNQTNLESAEIDDLDMEAWRELPQGILDEEEFVDELRKNKQNEIASEELQLSGISTSPMDTHYPTMTNDYVRDGASSEINEVAELPVGLLDDDKTSEFESKVSVTTTSLEDDIPKEIQLDEQQLGEEETQTTEESDGWVLLKDEEKGGALFLTEEGNHLRVENEQQSMTTDFTGNDRYDMIDENMSLEVKEAPVEEEVKEVPAEEEKKKEELEVKEEPIIETPKEVNKREAPEAEGDVKEAQSESGDIIYGEVIDADVDNSEATAEQKDEKSIRWPISKEVEKDSDKNLVEENEKLRQMMQKLLEAGNEQLAVISNLSGRVRELEKKLARKKRVRMSKPSCKKSSNNPLQERAVELKKPKQNNAKTYACAKKTIFLNSSVLSPNSSRRNRRRLMMNLVTLAELPNWKNKVRSYFFDMLCLPM